LLSLVLAGLAVWWNVKGNSVYEAVFMKGDNRTTYFLTPDNSPLGECDFLSRNLGDE
jgi:hypothetical protein